MKFAVDLRCGTHESHNEVFEILIFAHFFAQKVEKISPDLKTKKLR